MTDRGRADGGSTEAVAVPPAGPEASSAPEAMQVYSKDYWDVVLSQIRRRRLSVTALYVLISLYAVAIFAPFLANDRPLYFEGVDLAAYRGAHREIGITVSTLADHAQQGEAAYRAAQSEAGANLDWPRLLEGEVRAAVVRIDAMRRQLSAPDARPLDELEQVLRETAGKAARGEPVSAAEALRLEGMAQTIAATMNPVVRTAEVVPGETVLLRPFRAWPVIENLGRGEIYFMVLMAVTLLFPVWNRIVNARLGHDRLRIRKARRRKALVFVLLPILAALAWQGQSAAFFVSGYKSGMTEGNVLAKTVIFAPVPYGIAESNNEENFRPPTWHPESRISEDGYYETGPRSGRIDQDTNLPKLAQPVQVEYGEPGRNSIFRHFLGTDSLGRDLLSRIIWGGRVSLAVGLVGTGILVFIGVILGSLAGYFGGWVDILISRIIEVVQTFPAFFLILIIVAFVGPSILNIMVIIGLVGWTGVARLVRGEFIRLRGQEFVIASEALGVNVGRTIFRHILPNALGPVLVAATFGVASGILTESALSFLGLGIQLPIPSWGSLLIESRSAEHWWIQIFPGLLIFLTVLLYNLFGEGVRDALDPRLKAIR